MAKKVSREHLFISYATEDYVFAEWLALRLTSDGHKVWCDRFELLGGESYPKDIDKAIKNKTFRLLALMSHHSVDKDNPVKERTMALNVGKELKIPDFLIPLNIDGLSSTELDWMTGDITYIPFDKNWAVGYRQLLKKLSKIDTPQNVKDGPGIVSDVFLSLNQYIDEPEPIHSNCLKILNYPTIIKKYNIGSTVSWYALLDLAKQWPIYTKTIDTVYAFHDPPEDIVDNFKVHYRSSFNINENEEIEGIKIDNILINLLTRSLNALFVQKGLWFHDKQIYYPFDLFDKNKIHFETYTNKNTTVQVAGTRKWTIAGQESKLYNYHLAPRFFVRLDPDYGYLAMLNIGLYLSDMDGKPLNKRAAIARSRRMRKSWWNHEWFSRYLATMSFLSDGEEKIIIGEKDAQIVINAHFEKGIAPISVVDEQVDEDTIDINIEEEIEEDIIIEEEDFDYDE
jgi:hypothetical protein